VRLAYLSVEGPHDAEFIGRILRAEGLQKVQQLANLDPHWHPLIPDKFPIRGELLTRPPIPLFFQSATISVAVHVAGSDSKIAATIEESLTILDFHQTQLHAIAAIIDADSATKTPRQRFDDLRTAIIERAPAIANWPNDPAVVHEGPPKTGVFVLPDNTNQGTLENLLLESAQHQWRGLHALSSQFVQDGRQLLPNNQSDINKPAGPNKATVGALANLFRPGKAIQVSLADQPWFAPDLPNHNALQSFLQALLR